MGAGRVNALHQLIHFMPLNARIDCVFVRWHRLCGDCVSVSMGELLQCATLQGWRVQWHLLLNATGLVGNPCGRWPMNTYHGTGCLVGRLVHGLGAGAHAG